MSASAYKVYATLAILNGECFYGGRVYRHLVGPDR